MGEARELTCVLCGGPADQLARFCTDCVGEQGRPTTPRWARPVSLEPPRLGFLVGLRWPLVLLLLGGVGLAGARAGQSVLATERTGHAVAHARLTLHTPAAASIIRLERNLSLGQVAVTAVIGLVFLAWWAMAYRNLVAMGVRRRNTTRWAVGSWFVPVVGLIAPKRVADELWFGSDAETPLGWSYTRGSASSLVTAWWACWVASVALPPTALLAVTGVARWAPALLAPAVVGSGAAFAVSAVLVGLAGLLAVAMVVDVTAGQVDRAKAIEAAGLLVHA